jgi:hypothetical protein
MHRIGAALTRSLYTSVSRPITLTLVVRVVDSVLVHHSRDLRRPSSSCISHSSRKRLFVEGLEVGSKVAGEGDIGNRKPRAELSSLPGSDSN